MDSEDRGRIRSYYIDAYNKYGSSVQSLHWSDDVNQEVRFDAIRSLGQFENASVLDVGCGFADLYRYFLKSKVSVQYKGIDILPEFIEEARSRYPDIEVDLQDMQDISDEYDYIVVSGAFNFAVKGGVDHYMRIIANLFSHARVGLICNFLDERFHETSDIYLAYNKREVITFAEKLTPHVKTADGYLPWDFTIALYKSKNI